LPALRELVTEGRRLLDAQERAKSRQDAKARHLTTTCITILTAGAAATSLFAESVAGWRLVPALALLVAGLACIGRAFLLFSASYTGHRLRPNDLAVGWDPNAIRAAAALGLGSEAIFRGIAEKMPTWIDRNREALDRSVDEGRAGNEWLFWGTAVLVASLIYGVAARGSP
jgi:hypothetical protein